MKRGSTKIAQLPVGLRGQIVSLRKGGMNCADICARLQLDRQSERNAVSAICAEPGLRAFGHGMDVSGPVKRGPNRADVGDADCRITTTRPLTSRRDTVKLTATREDLLGPLQAVMPAIASKAQIPILGNVLLLADDFLSITATNLETQIKSRADVQSDSGFGVTVPARKLFDILRLAPEGATVKLEADAGKLKVKAGPSRYTLVTQPVENFPAFVTSDLEQSVSLPAETLLRGFKRVAFCMANGDVRYYLNGLAIRIKSGSIETVASDGHRLAMQTMALDHVTTDGELKIIPRDAVMGIIKFLSEAIKQTSGQIVRLSIGVNTASVTLVSDEGDGTQFSTKLIEGKYPQVERVIPKETSTRFAVPVSGLVSSIQRAGVVSEGKDNRIQVDIAQDQLSVLSANSEGEQALEEMAITLDGEPLTLGFNGAYLMDALNVVEADLAELKLSEKSGLVLDPNDSGWLSVVMPMRI